MSERLKIADTTSIPPSPEAVDALVGIIKFLTPLSESDRTRTLEAVCEFLNMRPYVPVGQFSPTRPQGGAAR